MPAIQPHVPREVTTLLRALCVVAAAALAGCPAGSGEGLDENGRPLGETPDDDDTPAPVASFAQLQQDIFTPLCTVCHAGAAAPVGLRLDAANSYASIVGVPSVQTPAILRVSPGNRPRPALHESGGFRG